MPAVESRDVGAGHSLIHLSQLLRAPVVPQSGVDSSDENGDIFHG
ncbi:hypothetical protein [Mycobacterium intracellulare]|nr:hypothetical protein [Mycobacterium intracellulare]